MSHLYAMIFLYWIQSSTENTCTDLNNFPWLFNNNYTANDTPIQSMSKNGILQCVEECRQDGVCQGVTFHQFSGLCTLYPTLGHSNTNKRGILITSHIRDWEETETVSERNNTIRKVHGCAVLRKSKLIYNGTKSVTIGGFQCQRWNSQHTHKHPQKHFYGDEVAEVSNYCRTTEENEDAVPWCYTTSPGVRWQFCRVDICNPAQDSDGSCYSVKNGVEIFYNGTRNTTMSGLNCQRWDRQTPHRHGYNLTDFPSCDSMGEVGNYCQVLSKSRLELPWCYTVDSKVRWEVCVTTPC